MQHASTIGRGIRRGIDRSAADNEQTRLEEFVSQLSGLVKLIIVIAFAWLVVTIVSTADAFRTIAPRFSHPFRRGTASR